MRKSPSNSSLHGQLTNEIQNGVSISRPTGYRLMQNGGASPPGEPFAVTYAYDANGNVSEYVSINGSIVAHYDYSPFGETLIASGDLASTFTHRFSTKPWCPVTGLYEYQMRKYRPGIGRWLSRDPIEETPIICLAVNLLSRLRIAQFVQTFHFDDAKYSFIFNNVNLIDVLGEQPRDKHYGLPPRFWDWYHIKVKKGKKIPVLVCRQIPPFLDTPFERFEDYHHAKDNGPP